MNKKNIGLVGAGYWGKNLVRVFAELGVLKTICDTDKKVLAERKKEHPQLKTTKNYNDLLKDKDIKGIVISAPAALHYKLSKKVLLSDKDVFVEKPLALKVKEAEKLVKLSEKKNLILMVGHLLLYHPAIIELKKIIKAKKLGEVQYIYSNRLNFGKLRTEENVLWSFAPHDVAVMLDLFKEGSEKINKLKISATANSYLQKKINDFALVNFQFKNKKAGHVFVSWLNPFKEQKLVVIGAKKMAVFDDQSDKKLIIFNHKVKWKNKIPEAVKGKEEVIKIARSEPLKEEAKYFLECIQKRKTSLTDGREGLEVLKVLDACQKSIKNKGKLINI